MHHDDTLRTLVPRWNEAWAAAAIWHKTVSQHEALRFATRQLWGLNAIGGGNCASNKMNLMA